MRRLAVLNGPNLNLLGTRDPAVYGSTTLDELDSLCREWGAEIGVSVDTFQSNHEGEIIDRLHAARSDADGVVLNPGALTHSSYALADAIDGVDVPVVETHLSNILEREPFRRISLIRPVVAASVYGRGIDGYRWAMRHLVHRAEWPVETVSYGDSDDQVLDLRRPASEGPHAAVVLVHGGFWRHMWTRDVTEGIAVDLARRGFLSVNVEYRRVGAGGGWPHTVDDVTRAIDAIDAMAEVSSIAAIGHSAGGHLVMTAARHTSADVVPVSLGGVLDLERAAAEDVGNGAVDGFLGGADPVAASPRRNPAANAIVIHGTADDRVPVSQSRAYAEADPDATLVELDGVGHFEFLERSDPAWERVVETLVAVLGSPV